MAKTPTMSKSESSAAQYIAAQKQAPSFFWIPDEGIAHGCTSCGKRDREPFVKIFTTDAKPHPLLHAACVEEFWMNEAKDMGTIKID